MALPDEPRMVAIASIIEEANEVARTLNDTLKSIASGPLTALVALQIVHHCIILEMGQEERPNLKADLARIRTRLQELIDSFEEASS